MLYGQEFDSRSPIAVIRLVIDLYQDNFTHFTCLEKYSTRCYSVAMRMLMTKRFAKWATKQNIPSG